MISFCPTCGNLLLVENQGGDHSYICETCPYQYGIKKEITKSVALKTKEIDDVLGGEEAWKNVQKTEASCPKCSHTQAYFMEIQIRSADEPATIFYKCVECANQWREH